MGAPLGGSNFGTDASGSSLERARSSGRRAGARDDDEPRSNSSSIPRMPFLNSTIPLPSERPTSGSRLPNRRTATPITRIISNGPRFGNMPAAPVEFVRSSPGRPAAHSLRARGGRGRLLVGRDGAIHLVLDLAHAFLELGHALAERAHHAGQAVAEDQQRDEGDDDQFGRTDAGKEGERQHGLAPRAQARLQAGNTGTVATWIGGTGPRAPRATITGAPSTRRRSRFGSRSRQP